MLKLTRLVFILTLSLSSVALVGCDRSEKKTSGPIVVGNGGGESEYLLVYVRTHLNELFHLCDESICSLTPESKSDFERLKAASVNPPKALFGRDRELNGKAFELREVSGGSKEVWFNQDALWADKNKSKPYDIQAATKLWIEALGESLALQPSSREEISEALRPMIDSNIRTISTIPVSGATFQVALWRREAGNDRIYLRDSQDFVFDMSTLTEEVLRCDQQVSKLRLHSARWAVVDTETPGLLKLRLALKATWLCNGQTFRGRLDVAASAQDSQKSDVKSKIDSSTLKIFLSGD